MKVGIFFGGKSAEREVSFAGGRTVFDNLDKSLFEPVPVFVDSLNNFILLDKHFLYKGSIRDFYPASDFIPDNSGDFQYYIENIDTQDPETLKAIIGKAGIRIDPRNFAKLFDFVFLALHGPYGEDGTIQGILEWYNIPYSGSGIFPSAAGLDKSIQKELLKAAGFNQPRYEIVSEAVLTDKEHTKKVFQQLKKTVGLPMVAKNPRQGSSIGIAVIEEDTVDAFITAVKKALLIREITADEWNAASSKEKKNIVRSIADPREGTGMPITVGEAVISDPAELVDKLNLYLSNNLSINIQNIDNEKFIILEEFIKGREFSCIIIQNEKGQPVALPPTEIIKGKEIFDYRSKYLPGIIRKITPIDLPETDIAVIRRDCEHLFSVLNCNVYARIDGFFTEKGEIFLNDPNTTSGMMPSSFFFHQAAEIGLNPSQFLTYIIRTSLAERAKSGKSVQKSIKLLSELDNTLLTQNKSGIKKKKVGVILGGYSSERHISVESGRNIYEKLASSVKYEPVPIFLTGDEDNYEMYIIPVNILLKDNADDIREKILSGKNTEKHPSVDQIITETKEITRKYAGNPSFGTEKIDFPALAKQVDAVFIALHGRPGEDGAIQAELEKYDIPYNGSGTHSSQVTINKFETKEKLKKFGIKTARHRLIQKEEFIADKKALTESIEQAFPYPFIAKPADDGCSSAVKKIGTRNELEAFIELIFREKNELSAKAAEVLRLLPKEEFPQKTFFLIEKLIEKGKAHRFLEITGGLLTGFTSEGSIVYELFEPSETPAGGEVLSLEEKFLAGEGQNITPARFSPDKNENKRISAIVRKELENAATLLNIEGYARIDAFVRIYEDGKVETIIIEVNSLPGMTPATCIFHQTALNGYTPYEFIDAILEFGIKRNNLRKIYR